MHGTRIKIEEMLEVFGYNTIHQNLSVFSTVAINSALTGVRTELIPEEEGYCRHKAMLSCAGDKDRFN